MKRLLFIFALAALAVSVRAQTTNIIFAITIEEGTTRTNVMTVTASAKEIRGLNVNWEKDLMVAVQQTNAAPSFRKSVQDWQKAQLAPLQVIADADERKKSKVTDLLAVIAANWDSLNSTQKQQLKDMATALGL